MAAARPLRAGRLQFVVVAAAAAALLLAASSAAAAGDCARLGAACTSCTVQRIPGTKSSELVCTKCAQGTRLRDDGKACDCAPGYAQTTDGGCVPCPLRRYCPGGSAANPSGAAVACPAGLASVLSGAKSVAECLTLPGYGRVAVKGPNGALTYTGQLCPPGTFNAGGNTQAQCQACPGGAATLGEGSTSSAACVKNTRRLTSVEATPAPPAKPAAATPTKAAAPKAAAPTKPAAAPAKLSSATAATAAAACAASPQQCNVKPGHEVDPLTGALQPCRKGTYSPGSGSGSGSGPAPRCVRCPSGTTTAEDAARSARECTQCLPGHGGAGCRACGYDSFSFGGGAGAACAACAPGTVAARGRCNSEQCYPELMLPAMDAFPSGTAAGEAAWRDAPAGAGSADECAAACAAAPACAASRFGTGPDAGAAPRCQHLNAAAAPSASAPLLGFKVADGDDYALWAAPPALVSGGFGEPRGPRKDGAELLACLRSCTKDNACEAVTFVPAAGGSTGACRLWASVLDADWTVQLRVAGSRLFTDSDSAVAAGVCGGNGGGGAASSLEAAARVAASSSGSGGKKANTPTTH